MGKEKIFGLVNGFVGLHVVQMTMYKSEGVETVLS